MGARSVPCRPGSVGVGTEQGAVKKQRCQQGGQAHPNSPEAQRWARAGLGIRGENENLRRGQQAGLGFGPLCCN